MFDQSRLYAAALNVAPFALASILFAFSRFSFGYVLGFYFYTMILGYLWLVAFSRFNYDHALATISAFGSALAFLVPALFITSPIRQRFTLSARALENLLSVILIFAAAIVAAGAFYNFRLVGVADIYRLSQRTAISRLAGLCHGRDVDALLPFAFACFVARGDRWRAAAGAAAVAAVLSDYAHQACALCSVLAAVSVLLLSRFFEARTSVVLSLFVPYRSESLLAFLSSRNYFLSTR